MDLQAQDRAHRIGQTRPVLVFRLVTNYSVETKIMAKSGEKRKLEALVIAKGQTGCSFFFQERVTNFAMIPNIGKFKLPHGKAASRQESMAEMAQTLLQLESEKIHIVSSIQDTKADELISDEALEKLLDRSPDVFEERGKGWKVDRAKDKQKGEITAFEVFEQVADQANNGLARMMGEED
jgi:ATP-dependent DNA helicase